MARAAATLAQVAHGDSEVWRGGKLYFHGEGKSFLPTPRVEVIVTLGAGDAFAACYVTQYLDGLTRK